MSAPAPSLPLVIAGFDLGDNFFTNIINAVFSAGIFVGLVILLAIAALAAGVVVVFLGSVTQENRRRKRQRAKEDWPNPSYETGLMQRLKNQIARQNS